MNDDIVIRSVSVSDAERLIEIYAPYVRESAVSFEWDVPGKEEFRHRIENITRVYPYLAAEKNGVVVGYAYGGRFKERVAYSWSVETTVYVDRDLRREGIGALLYKALEEALRKQNFTNMNACIAQTDRENDEYLPPDSISFHSRMGFRSVGKFTDCAYKFGRWYNMVWMEKMIGSHGDKPAHIIPFSDL